jgi:ATP-dependent DNA helicase RecG
MDIRKLIQTGETETVEFKTTFGKEVIISLSAFANTAGGKVVVGVDNAGRPTGIQVGPESEQRYINEIKTATYPQIIPHVTSFEMGGRTVLVFEINEYPVKPVSCKNRYYKRVKNSNHLLSLDEIVDLKQQSLNISYDAYRLKEPLESLDRLLMEQFIEKANSTGRVNLGDDLLTNLTKLKLIHNGRPTLASMLLFGNHGYTLHIGRFKAPDTIIDDLLLKAPLLTALDEAMLFIKKHINLSYDFDGSLQRKERWQYPLEALRELLLNAVVHRDYKNTSDIVIKIFDDRILFTSPGRIYGNLTIADLQRDDYVSSIRNKLLAESFYLLGEIEKYGTGFVRIRQWLQGYPEIEYEISEMGDYFRFELVQSQSKRSEKLSEKLPEKLPDLQKAIVLQMRSDPKVTYDQLAKTTKKSREAIRKNIRRLKELGIIKRIGPDKGGHWQVTLTEK